MSNEIEKRIVELEFKNDQFEKNASKTLQTLEQLKRKLDSNFSTKGAEELNKAIKNVDVSPIIGGLETVQVKFNALQIVGKRIIENITDAAMSAVHKVSSSLTGIVNQIKVGGANRAQNIAQAKFMLSGLGIEWKDIVDDINYGVQDTAYGLDAAAKVASQLVTSNVQLGDDMRQALRGISGIAAMSNSTYEEIGNIFTAIAGQGRVMSIQLNQLAIRGLNATAVLAKALNTTEAEVKDMVSKGQVDFQTFAKAMDDAYGEHAKEANKTFTGALSNTKAALSRLGADIQTQKFESFRIILLEVTAQLKELKKAFKPAEDAIISMMEAVGKLVANFIKAIDIKSIVEKISPAIEKVANYVKDFADAWRELREEATPVENMAEYVTKLREQMGLTTEAAEEVIDVYDKLAQAKESDLERYSKQAWDIWNWGAYGNGQDRVDALGEDYELTQAYVEKMIELGWDEAKMQEYLTEQREKAVKQQVKAETVNRLKNTVSKILNIFTNLRTVMKNISSSVINVFGAIFSGLSEAVKGKNAGVLDVIVLLTGKIADLSSKIAITKEKAEKIKPVAREIGNIVVTIVKGLATAIKHIVTLLSKAAQSKVVKGIFEAIGKAINKIFEAIGKLYTRLKESGVWDKLVDALKEVATWLGEKIIWGFEKLGDVADTIGGGLAVIFEKVVGKVSELSNNAEKGHGWLSKIGDFFKEDVLSGSWITKLKDTLDSIFGTGKDVFQTAFQKTSDFVSGIVKGIKSIDGDDLNFIIKMLTNIALTLTSIKWLYSLSAMNNSITTTFKSFGKVFESIGFTIKKYGQRADAERFETFAKTVAIIVGAVVGMMIAFAVLEYKGFDASKIAFICGNIIGSITVVVGAVMVLTTWLGRAAAYTNTSKSMNILTSFRIPELAVTLIAIGYLLKTLVTSVMTLYQLITSAGYNDKAMIVVGLTLGTLLAAIMGFVAYAVKADKTMVGLSGFALTLISMAILFSVVIKSFKKVLKIIDDFDPDTVWRAVGVITALISPILIFSAVLVALTRKTKINNATQINPFKGVFGLFVGLAVMLRVGFVPLLKAIAEIRKDGDIGSSVISDFKSIVNTLYILIGLITVVVTVLGNFKYNGRNIGSAALGQNKMTGGFSTGGASGAFVGIMGIIFSIAAVIYTMSLAIKSLKGVDVSAIRQFKEMVLLIVGIIALLSIALTALGTLDVSKGATGVLLAVAGIIIGIAAVMAASAWSFKTFQESLQALVDYLPVGLKKILEFFEMLSDKQVREQLIQGVANIAQVLHGALWAAIVGWTEGGIEYMPQMVKNLFATVIVALNSLADEINKQGPELVNAAERCAISMTKFLLLVRTKLKEVGGKIFKKLGAEIGYQIGRALIETMNPAIKKVLGLNDLNLGEDDFLSDDFAEAEMEALAKREEKLKQAYIDTTDGWLQQAEKENQKYESKVNTEITLDDEEIIKNFKSRFGDLTGNLKGTLAEGIASGKFGSIDLTTMFKLNDFSPLGEDFNIDSFIEAFPQLDFASEEGIENSIQTLTDGEGDLSEIFGEYADMFGNSGEENMDAYGDAIRERMSFVTDITDEAMKMNIEEAKKFESEYYELGKNAAVGYAEGMTSMSALVTVMKAARTLAKVSENTMKGKEALDERSPSHVFEKIGIFTVLGFAEGIRNSVGYAAEATAEAGEAVILSMRETISRASLEAIEGIDQPHITPILDLSNVTDGIQVMNGLFDETPSYELAMATSGEAKLATERRTAAFYQSSNPYDDTNAIGAINSLNNEVSTLKGAIEGMQVVIDGRALVGQIATPIDKALGRKTNAGRRGI